jgi:ligand-binding sensor domain-containing protein
VKRAFALVLVAGLGGVIAVGVSIWKATRAVEQSKGIVRSEGQFAVRTVALDKPASDGFEVINSPAQFRRAALFGSHLYISGPSGLLAYDLEGALRLRYSTGRELPAAPLVDIAAGLGSASGQPVLWIATAGAGLLSFDGSRFVQIRSEDDTARSLTAVLPLASGRVLLGTEKRGVLVWDGKKLEQFHASMAGISITAMAGSEADLWVGTLDRGVLHWHAGELDTFSEGQGLPDPRVLSLAVDGERAFIGTALGVAEFRGGRFLRALAEGYFAKALLARHDALTIGTLEEGLLDIPLASERPRPRVAKAAENFGTVEQLFDMQGRTYALTGTGLFQAAPGGVYQPVLERPRAALADGNISALGVDRAGRLWVGYFDRGMDILEPGLDRSRHLEDQHLFCVNRIVHDRDGGLSAVATANGLVLFDAAGQQKQVLTKSDGLIANNVSDVLLRGEGGARSIMVATPAGLTTLDGAGTNSIYAFHGLVNNHAYALAASGSRTLVGTLGGLSIVDSGLVSASFTTANSGLRHNWITAIVPAANEWFIGTYGAGVVKLDSTGRWTTFPDLRPPLEINQNAMVVTDDAVYAGTLGRGLAVYRRALGRWTMIARGLPSPNVTALALGGGYLYIGTDNGLVRAPERSVLGQ